MSKSPPLIVAFACVALLAACHPASRLTEGRTLFDIGYGKSDSSLDVASAGQSDISISMNRGIMHLLSRGEGKILRVSSYGQTLTMWYDPRKGSAPLLLKSVAMDDLAAAKELGRFAIQVPFTDPSLLAVDARQRLYVADAGMIRRFESDGSELRPLGREGPDSSPFSGVTELKVLENDELAVSCVSESGTEIYFFERAGGFLNRLSLGDQNLPTPAPLAQKYSRGAGSRIIASLETEEPSLLGGKLAVFLKMNYYLEKTDPQSGVTLSIDPAGSWIIAVAAATGDILDSFALQSSVSDSGIDQELIAVSSGEIICVRWANESIGGDIFCYSQKGKIVGKRSFTTPDKDAELVALAVGDDRQLYILGKLPATLRVYEWALPGA